MTRRSRKQLHAEFDRLYAIFETQIAFQRERLAPEHRDALDLVISKEAMLSAVQDGRATLSACLSGVTQAINDFNLGLMEDTGDGGRMVDDFLAFYGARHEGRSYFRDVGSPEKLVRKVLRRGRIRTEAEWFLVKEITDDLSQGLLGAEVCQRLDAMRAAFERETGAP